MHSSTAVKSGGSVHIWTPHCQKVGGSGPQDPPRIAATDYITLHYTRLTVMNIVYLDVLL